MKNVIIKYTILLLFAVFPFLVFGADLDMPEVKELGFEDKMSYMLIGIVGTVALCALLVSVYALRVVMRTGPAGSLWKMFSQQMTDAVPLDHERDVLLDHDYDGIRELDNNLPPWWLYGFYLSIVIAIIYIGVQHFSSYGKNQIEEYEIEMAQAKIAVEKYLSTQADLVDETNVSLLTDEVNLGEGQAIFVANCAACHLDHGGGGPGSVGPNLTDKYWLHGGSIKDVFKTVKYGVPEKGMISWKAQLRPADMHKVSSYILSLQGTNPPGAKEPQGALYVAEATTDATETK